MYIALSALSLNDGQCGRLPENRDVVGIAAERGDVALHALQSGDLIEQAVIARSVLRRFRRQLRVRQKAEDPDAVVDGNDNGATRRQPRAVEGRIGRGTLLTTAALDPDQHRQFSKACLGRCPDIEKQAVFAARLVAGIFIIYRGF
jgi:hypothetical protein